MRPRGLKITPEGLAAAPADDAGAPLPEEPAKRSETKTRCLREGLRLPRFDGQRPQTTCADLGSALIDAGQGPQTTCANSSVGSCGIRGCVCASSAVITWSAPRRPPCRRWPVRWLRDREPSADPDGVAELPRYMGDWYVIVYIPTFIEKNAHDAWKATRSRRTARSRRPSPSRWRTGRTGEAIQHAPGVCPGSGVSTQRGVCSSSGRSGPSNGSRTWTGLTRRSTTARAARDYVWMAREPEIPAADYARHVAHRRLGGYDATQLRRVPQAHATRRGAGQMTGR